MKATLQRKSPGRARAPWRVTAPEAARTGSTGPGAEGATAPAQRAGDMDWSFGRVAPIRTADPHEQEADRIASELVRMPAPVRGTLHRERLQLAPLPGAASSSASGLPSRDTAPSGVGQPLSASVRGYFEPRFGHDLGRVRLFTSAPDAQRARALNARAYTVGSNIVFGPGAYAPETGPGRWLLAHELTHVIQQQGAAPRVQKFEAGLHQAAGLTGMTTSGPGKHAGLTLEEANAAYFGNWMRDMNQILVPMSNAFTPELIYAFINYLAMKKFGRSVTPEQFGYYIPAEHIDNPAGVVPELDLLPGPRKHSSKAGRTAPLFEKYKTPQERTGPAATVQGANLFSADQTGVMAHIRRTNMHVERRLELAVELGRNPDGLMHFGAALHAVEDLFAHSNWVEIAVGETLKSNPRLLPELKGEERQVFTFSPKVNTGKQTRPVLTTGSFSSLDTQISIASELVTMLRKPPSPPRSLAEAKAEEYFIAQLLNTFQDQLQNDAQLQNKINKLFPGLATAILQVPLGDIYLMTRLPDWLRELLRKVPLIAELKQFLHEAVYTKACLPLADKLEAGIPKGQVNETPLVENLEELRDVMAGKPIPPGPMDAIALAQGTSLEELEKNKRQEARVRVGALEATPAPVVAGPSHSQLAKDHPNSPFFGLAFTLAVDADRRLKDRLIEAWRERHNAAADKPFKFAGPPADENARKLQETHQEEVEKIVHRGRNIVAQGRELQETAYDIPAMRKETADQFRSIASVLRSPQRSGKQLRMLKDQLGIENEPSVDEAIERVGRSSNQLGRRLSLPELTKKLEQQADRIEARGRSPSLGERAQLHEDLLKLQQEADRALLENPSLESGFRGTVLHILDTAISSTAVSYKPRQRELLEGQRAIPRVKKGLTVQKLVLPGLQGKRPFLRALLQTSRDLITHPLERSKGGFWWKELVRDFIRKHPKQLAAEIEARNKGYLLFRNPGTPGGGHPH